MKSVLLSIQPKWVYEILNGRKTIEIRRKFPKDYVGWVYIYCTRNGINIEKDCGLGFPERINGKVVARFWCDNVENIYIGFEEKFDDGKIGIDYEDFDYSLLDKSCLTERDLIYYCKPLVYDSWDYYHMNIYVIHISKLEIFDRPKDISEFKQPRDSYGKVNWNTNEYYYMELTKAPQNYCYVEGE